jgi:hypothetical protein
MQRFVFVLVLFTRIATTSSVQQVDHTTSNDDIRLSKDKPGIYLTFERRGKGIDPMQTRMAETGNTSKSKEKGQDIWLRLHNNTRWAILFPTWSLYVGPGVAPFRLSDGTSVLSLSDGMEVSAKYQVEESDGKVVPYGIDVSSQSWLAPGRSIIFSVDREHLTKGRSIYVYFTYEWERGQQYSNNLSPEHRSMYWGYRLQEDDK